MIDYDKKITQELAQANKAYTKAMIKAGYIPEAWISSPLKDAVVALVKVRTTMMTLSEKYEDMLKEKMEMETQKKALFNIQKSRAISGPMKTRNKIIDLVSKKRGYTLEEMKEKTRRGDLVAARNHCYHELYEGTSLSYSGIGRIFKRDHSTVLHGIKKHKKSLAA